MSPNQVPTAYTAPTIKDLPDAVQGSLDSVQSWIAQPSPIMTKGHLKGYMHELSRGEHEGFPWYVGHNDIGFRTGYIRVPKGHPWFHKSYDDIDCDVHGGLTYSDKGPPGKIPKFSYGWWVGFDCGHAYDCADKTIYTDKAALKFFEDYEYEHDKPFMLFDQRFGTVRTTEYVEAQCISLCEQAFEAVLEA